MSVADRTPENLYLLGHPVAHSKSPVMHNAAYRYLGLPWTYSLADRETEDDAQAFLAARDFLAINITTPYKPLGFLAAARKDAAATLAQGANVLVRHGDELVGCNTDGTGCVAFLERTGFSFSGKRVAVCGTGPTALSIMYASALAGADTVLLAGRDKERTRRVLESFIERFGLLVNGTAAADEAARPGHRSPRAAYELAHFRFGGYAANADELASADLVVNATPLGMCKGDGAPFDTGLLHASQTVFDAVYGHGRTAVVHAASEAGCRVHDGAGMLVAQAVATVRIVCAHAVPNLALDEAALFDCMAAAAEFDI